MTERTAAARRDIEHACARLVTRFMTFFDAQEYAAIGPLFAPEGVLVRCTIGVVSPQCALTTQGVNEPGARAPRSSPVAESLPSKKRRLPDRAGRDSARLVRPAEPAGGRDPVRDRTGDRARGAATGAVRIAGDKQGAPAPRSCKD